MQFQFRKKKKHNPFPRNFITKVPLIFIEEILGSLIPLALR